MDVCKVKPPHRTPWGNCSMLDLYAKNIYNPIVKVTEWEKYKESLPIDVNPYDTAAFDLHFSHYNKMGGDDSPVDYTTTTQEMLAQALTKRPEFEINPNKVLFNLNSEMNQTCAQKKRQVCSSPFGADFITTMQNSYQPPYPYILKGLSMAEPPYFLHRFVKERIMSKFWDEGYRCHTKKLQDYKGSKHISFNPCTGYYTDGTLGDTRDIY